MSIGGVTLGGLQLWADRRVQGGWRLQQRAGRGDCRLLDELDRCRAAGGFADCLQAMARLAPPQTARRIVLMLSGLARSRLLVRGLARRLEETGRQVYRLSWPTTRCGYAEHAERLREVLDGLPAGTEVGFVTFSAGGPLLRMTLAMPGEWRGRLTLGPTVMIGPPSRGARIAAMLYPLAPFRWLYGPLLRELSPEHAAFPPLPPRTTIIAGAPRLRGWRGYNPLLPGDNDGIVCLDEACLPEAERIVVVPALHAALVSRRETVAATLAAFSPPFPSAGATTASASAILRS